MRASSVVFPAVYPTEMNRLTLIEPMPILPQEPDMYPEHLLEQEAAPESVWRVVYTLSRREKDLMRRLRVSKVPHYGPLVKRRTQSPSGRSRESFVPLFPGYIFMYCGDDGRYEAMKTNCISSCLDVADQQQLVFDLQQIRQLINSDAPLTPEQKISPGTRVRVRAGSMAGLEGIVLKRRAETRLLVAIEFLQQGASVSIEDYQLEEI